MIELPEEEVFEVNALVLSKFIIRDLIPIIGDDTYPVNELMLMSAAVHRIRPTHIIEWGTNTGKSARIFHEIITKFNINCEIHSIDLPDDATHEEHNHKVRGELVKHIGSIKLHQGDGLKEAIKIASALDNNARILFFVDGDHLYDSVYREVFSLIKMFGNHNILVHDTFYQYKQSGYNIGPITAVRDALNINTNNTFKVLTINIGGPGMCLLYNLPKIDHKLLQIEWVK
jgi:cephalosporin hydroxylase